MEIWERARDPLQIYGIKLLSVTVHVRLVTNENNLLPYNSKYVAVHVYRGNERVKVNYS